jgi:hypothetical protein
MPLRVVSEFDYAGPNRNRPIDPGLNISIKQNMSIRNLVFAYTLQIYH